MTCRNAITFRTNPDCEVQLDPGAGGRVTTEHVFIAITGVPVEITAMSLPWGGLLDINGNWQPPHVTHNTGRVLDISFKDRRGLVMDEEHKLLLRQVVRDSTNFLSLERCEGERNLQTANGCTHRDPRTGNLVPFITDHLHVNFRS